MIFSATPNGRIRRTIDTLGQAVSLVSGLISVVPFAVASAAALWAGLANDLPLEMFADGFVVALLFVAAAAFASRGFLRRIVWGYRINRTELIDVVDEWNPAVHHVRNRMEITTVRAGLRGIWSGYRSQTPSGLARGGAPPPHAPRATSAGHCCGDPREEAGRWMFPIFFDGPQPIGRRIEVQYAHDIFEGPSADRSWVSKVVVDPIDELEIRVRMPVNAWPADIEGRQIIVGKDRSRTLALELDSAIGEARLLVKRPEVGSEYAIGWTRCRASESPPPHGIRAFDRRARTVRR